MRHSSMRVPLGPHTDVSECVVAVDSIPTMLRNAALKRRVQRTFNRHGVVVLDCAEADFKSHQSMLGEVFGTVVPHMKADEHGQLMIDALAPHSVNSAANLKPHAMHTDEAYAEAASRVLTLWCEIPAVSGGESTFVSAQRMLDEMVARGHDLGVLFEPDCLTVGRTLPGLSTEEVCNMAVLNRVTRRRAVALDTGAKESALAEPADERAATVEAEEVHFRFRSLDSYIKTVRPDARDLIAEMSEYANDPANQLKVPLRRNQIAIFDNTGLTHGRTAFDKSEGRRMWRMNFFNDNGEWATKLRHGVSIE